MAYYYNEIAQTLGSKSGKYKENPTTSLVFYDLCWLKIPPRVT